MKKVLYTQNGHKVVIDIPPPSNIQSFFAFALHKSGSVLMDKLLQDICASLSIPTLGFENILFEQGYVDGLIALAHEDIKEIFVREGYCFHGFRVLPSYLDNFDFSGLKKILLIRDPRDILVSYYFSVRASHVMTQGEAGKCLLEQRQEANKLNVDDYVIQIAPFFKEAFNKYEKIEDSRLKLFRYEDIVFNKHQWICDILDFLNLKFDDRKIIEIANKHDVFPTQEDSSSHIRRVTPGDHIRKLKPDTIKFLNEYFEDVLIKYGYDFDGRLVERQALEIYFNQSQKRIQALEDKVNQSQLEAERSQSQLENTQLELEQTQGKLQTVELKLERSQRQLQTIQPALERSQNQVKQLRAKTQRQREKISKLTIQLQDVGVELSSIKESKFWHLWSIGLRLKSWLKLKSPEPKSPKLKT